MWNRRKEEEPSPRLTPQPPPPSALGREGIPVSPLPSRSEFEQRSAGGAGIGKSVVIKGQLFAREDLYLDGEVEGTIELPENRLTVGPNGRLKASVKAREIIVLGSIHGNVEAIERIEIRKNAKLVGDIRTDRIMIEDEAFFKGSVDIVRQESPKAVRAAAAAAAAGAGATAAPAPAASPAPVNSGADVKR